MRFGAQISAAMPAPSQGHLVRRTPAYPQNTMPTARPPTSMTSRFLFSSPTPTAMPAPSHQRGRSRSKAVVTQSRTTVQASRSTAVVVLVCVPPITTGAHAVARAASTRPNRPAPNSAASLAATTTTVPPASAGMIRIAVGLTPSRPVMRVSSGVSGGWST